jgi:hypothetical protein
MQIFVISATLSELQTYYMAQSARIRTPRPGETALAVHIVHTGIGVAKTMYGLFQLARQINPREDILIDVGFGGCNDMELSIGDPVIVSEDTFWDYGIWREGEFISIEEFASINFPGKKAPGYYPATTLKVLPECWAKLPQVQGYTMSHPSLGVFHMGGAHNPEPEWMETMESAGFAMVVSRMGWKAISLRVVSNRVMQNDSAQWDRVKSSEALAEILHRGLLHYDQNYFISQT